MKKKIKDLTLDECRKICSNSICCSKCCLGKTLICKDIDIWVTPKMIRDLESEVEVDDK